VVPSKICHPDEIEKAIEELITNEKEMIRFGREVQKFVRENGTQNLWQDATCRLSVVIYLRNVGLNLGQFMGVGQAKEYTVTLLKKLIGRFGVKIFTVKP